MTRIGLTLGLLLGVPGLLLVLLRRLGVRLPGQPDGAGRLGIVSRLAVDGKHSLLLIRRDSHEQLIMLGPQGVTVLEAEVSLSPADCAAHKRRERERGAQAAASRAALQQVGAGAVRRVRQLVRTVSQRQGPSFRQMVDKARAA